MEKYKPYFIFVLIRSGQFDNANMDYSIESKSGYTRYGDPLRSRRQFIRKLTAYSIVIMNMVTLHVQCVVIVVLLTEKRPRAFGIIRPAFSAISSGLLGSDII